MRRPPSLLLPLLLLPLLPAGGAEPGVPGPRDAREGAEEAPLDDDTLRMLRSLQREIARTDAGPTSVSAMVDYLDVQAAELEDERDVKCWSSFGQLETFVAGSELRHETTHLKAEVVMNYLDQLWQAAANGSGGAPIDGPRFEERARTSFPRETVALEEVRVRMGSGTVHVPYQDVDNYASTVEPTRLLRTLAQRVAASEPGRPALSAAAIDAALYEAALLSTALLKQANLVARENQHPMIEDADVLEVDRRVALASGLAAYDEARHAPAEKRAPGAREASRAAMLAVIDDKIASLATFNTRFVRDRFVREFDTELSDFETDWAGGVPLEPDAASRYKQETLVELAGRLYREAARRNPNSELLSGREMLATILSFYPFASTRDGVTSLFPQAEDEAAYWVREFQADTFRDTGGHWQALRRAVVAADPGLPPMDLYAMEELSEFVSNYAVAVVHAAGARAQARKRASVSQEEIAWAHGLYERHRRAHHAAWKSGGDGAIHPAAEGGREEARARVRESLGSAYIGEIFSDVTAHSGIDFRHESSDAVLDYRFPIDAVSLAGLPNRRLAEAGYDRRYPNIEVGIGGGGVAVADVDGDGLLDVYLVSGKLDRLYRNLGNLRFEDVTEASGLENRREGRGAYFADYDNDGDPDLLVTHLHSPNRLFRNRGDGSFEDVTLRAGLPIARAPFTHSAVWFDYDNDGNLDLYLGNFGAWLQGERPRLHNSRNGRPNQLFRNDGKGRFVDVTEKTGAGDPGWAHAVSHFDANLDGWQDLYIANDFGRDTLLINEGGERFVDATPPSIQDRFLHGMSVSFADVNRDGVEDVYVSNIATFTFDSKYVLPDDRTSMILSRRTAENARMIESNLFLVSGEGTFSERHDERFDRSAEGAGWAWDADFFDFDNDGQEDLYITNGREPNLSYDRERNVLYKQQGGHFYDVSSGSGADFRSNARGAVHADLDGDGDLDIVVNNYQDRAVVLRNNLQRNHWVQFELEGTASNRDAVGARVTLHRGDDVQVRTVRGGSGFLSKEPNVVHFGLAGRDEIDRVEILWPSGRRQVLVAPAADRQHHVREPEADEAA